jgi:hypothetical protein
MTLTAEEKAAAKAAKEQEKAAAKAAEAESSSEKPGVIKEWTHNGHKMRRIRDEHGRITDVRL